MTLTWLLGVPPWVNAHSFLKSANNQALLIRVCRTYLRQLDVYFGDNFNYVTFLDSQWQQFRSIFVRCFNRSVYHGRPVFCLAIKPVGNLSSHQELICFSTRTVAQLPTNWAISTPSFVEQTHRHIDALVKQSPPATAFGSFTFLLKRY